jgi:hypothetical protein
MTGKELCEEVLAFIGRCESSFRVVSFGDAANILFVSAKLQKSTDVWFRLVAEEMLERSYEGFLEAYRSRFIHPEMMKISLNELRGLRMESWAKEYVERYRIVLGRCPVQSLEDNILNFTDGLPANEQEILYSNPTNCESIENMFATALRWEVSTGSAKPKIQALKVEKVRPLCSHSNKLGHVVEKCWRKFPEMKSRHFECRSHVSYEEEKVEDRTYTIALLAFQQGKINSNTNEFIIDSGCSDHMVGKGWDLEKVVAPHDTVTIANGDKLRITGAGTYNGECEFKNRYTPISLGKVLIVPELTKALLSVKTLVENGISITFEGHSVKLSCESKVFAEGAARGNLYYLTILPVETVNVADVDKWIMWYLRLNNASAGKIEKLKWQCAELKGVVFPSVFDCKDCAIGSVKKSNFQRKRDDYEPMQMVAIDMCGLFCTRSLGGSSFFLIMAVGWSRFSFIECMADKKPRMVAEAI